MTTELRRLELAIGWLYKSFEVTGRKGFSIGCDLRKGWRAPYSETTGYIIPTLYRYASLYNISKAHDIATDAAHWLLSIQNQDGSIIDFVGSSKSPVTRPPVIFNTGQDLFGLIAAFHATGNEMFINGAKKAAYWIISHQEKEGLWKDHTSFGSEGIAAYYSHVTWPLYLVGKLLGDSKISDSASISLNRILGLVNKNLSMTNWGFNKNASGFTHTIAYTIEGMIEQGLLENGITSKSFDMAKSISLKTIELLEKHNRLAGSYDLNWKGDYSYICMPGNCQMALIYLRLFDLLGDKRFFESAKRVLEPVYKHQITNGVFILRETKGAIPASWPPILGKYMRWLFPNWAVKYFVDSMMAIIISKEKSANFKPNHAYFELINQFPG